ncbi:MAG: UbiX family flavin prenyltransferase [Nitrospirae bacterium]|nr:UbiX family flavin prenyltransferase [Nitrospirota bacterium]
MPSYVVAITGASGGIYGIRLLEFLSTCKFRVYLTITKAAWYILKEETGFYCEGNEAEINSYLCSYFKAEPDNLLYYNEENFFAPIASGSVHTDGMIVVPCSMKAAASIAAGLASNLVARAADVILKEKRKLIIVPRETPLNSIHLRNLLTLSEMGAHIIPAMPAFYNKPKSIDDIVNFIAGRILDSLNIENTLYQRWGNPTEP